MDNFRQGQKIYSIALSLPFGSACFNKLSQNLVVLSRYKTSLVQSFARWLVLCQQSLQGRDRRRITPYTCLPGIPTFVAANLTVRLQ